MKPAREGQRQTDRQTDKRVYERFMEGGSLPLSLSHSICPSGRSQFDGLGDSHAPAVFGPADGEP